jgi:hypothetical protein
MTNLYINSRENNFNKILRVDPGFVLNSPEYSSGEIPGSSSLDLEIKQSLNRIKAEAISPDGSKVDYRSITASHSYREYKKLTSHLGNYDFKSLSSREEKLAFWINLYNALVIDVVIQAKTQSSVTEGWLGILRFFHQAAYLVGGERFSLSDIEHGVLRANSGFPYFPGSHFPAKDPRETAIIDPLDVRIHFALNCASNSCPPIGVYSPDQIDSQLDLAARSFINSDTKLDLSKKWLSISRIFRWYWVDFGGKEGILKILEKYLESPQRKKWNLKDLADLRLKFHPYDWKLNKFS